MNEELIERKPLTLVQKMGLTSMARTIVSGTDEIHEAEERDNKMHGVLQQSQIERVLRHCEKINEEKMKELDYDSAKIDYMITEERLGDFYINLGWIQALRLVLGADTVPISNSPLDTKYEKAYGILMDYFDKLPDEDKTIVHIALKEIGL